MFKEHRIVPDIMHISCVMQLQRYAPLAAQYPRVLHHNGLDLRLCLRSHLESCRPRFQGHIIYQQALKRLLACDKRSLNIICLTELSRQSTFGAYID